MPVISVLLPVFNNDKYIGESIRSILSQTFEDFEFIIIDDASTDNTAKILTTFSDPRIQILRNLKNQGLTRSLNIGLDLCKGKYLARMDSDDISHPERFARQLAFLEGHTSIGVLGTDYERIDSEGVHSGKISKHRTDWQLVHWLLNFDNPITHPTVCIRTDLIRQIGGYNEDFRYAQDYDLWDRLTRITRLTNLPETLLYRRYGHENQITTTGRKAQQECALKIQQQIVSRLTGQVFPFEVMQLWNAPSLDLDPVIKFNACIAIIKIFYSFIRNSRNLLKDHVLSIRKDSSKRIVRIAKSMPDCRRKSYVFFLNNMLIKFIDLYTFFMHEKSATKL